MLNPVPIFIIYAAFKCAFASTVSTSSLSPSEFRLGGIFPIFKTEKASIPFSYDSGGHNRFGGFYLAISEINNKTDGIADHLLPNTIIKFVLKDSKRDEGAAFFAAFQTQQSFNGLGVHAVVGAASSGPTINVQLVCAELETPQISYSATAATLSSDVEYPYFLRTVASDDFQAKVMVHILLHTSFSWTNVATIAGTDVYSSAGIDAFQNEALDAGIELIIHKYIVSHSDMSKSLTEIKNAGARIIVMFAQASDGMSVLNKSQELGMFGLDTGFVWIMSDAMANSDFDTLEEMLGENLGGSFFVQPSKPSGTKFDEYTERFSSTPSKLGSCAEKNTNSSSCNCNTEADDDGHLLWIRDHDGDPSTSARCVGIDFPNDGVNTYNPYAYDAVYVLATAAHALVESGVEEIEGPALFQELLNISYEGVTGLIQFGDQFGEIGDRYTGLRYELLNYHFATLDHVSVGSWTPEAGYHAHNATISFPTSDNSKPSDTVVPTCEMGEVFPAGSTACLRCEYGFFSLVPGEPRCHSCPEGAVCYGGSHVKALRGYWRLPNTTGICQEPYEDCLLNTCIIEEACGGDVLLATDAALIFESNVVVLANPLEHELLHLVMEKCVDNSIESSTSACAIVVQGNSFYLQNSDDVVDDSRILLDSTHLDASIGSLMDADVYLSLPEQCGDGYLGNLCAQCDGSLNYGSQFGLMCVECPESLAITYLVAAAGLAIIAMMTLTAIALKLRRRNLEETDKLSVILKIFLSWGQLFSLFLGIQLHWPLSISMLFQIEDVLFNFGARFLSVDCMFNQYRTDVESDSEVFGKLGLYLTLPVLAVFISCFIWGALCCIQLYKLKRHRWTKGYLVKRGLGAVCADGIIDQNEIEDTLIKLDQPHDPFRFHEVLQKLQKESKPSNKEKDSVGIEVKVEVERFQEIYISIVKSIYVSDAIMSIVVLLFMLYPSLILFSFRIFTCKKLGDGYYFLEDDLNVECYTQEYYKWVYCLGIPALLVYVIGIPLFLLFLVYRVKEQLEEPQNLLRLGFLYEGYCIKKYWWWESWVMVRKFCAVMLIVFATQLGDKTTVILLLFLLLFALYAQVRCHPYDDDSRKKGAAYSALRMHSPPNRMTSDQSPEPRHSNECTKHQSGCEGPDECYSALRHQLDMYFPEQKSDSDQLETKQTEDIVSQSGKTKQPDIVTESVQQNLFAMPQAENMLHPTKLPRRFSTFNFSMSSVGPKRRPSLLSSVMSNRSSFRYNFGRQSSLNKLEVCSLVATITTLLCGLVFEFSEMEQAGQTFFVIVVLGSNFYFVGLVALLGFKAVFRKIKKKIQTCQIGHTPRKIRPDT